MKSDQSTNPNDTNTAGARHGSKTPLPTTTPIDTLPTDHESGTIDIDNAPKPTDETIRKGPVGNRI